MPEGVIQTRVVFETFRAARNWLAVPKYSRSSRWCRADINRELAALKRSFSLGYKSSRILARPYIPTLLENNVRTGFFERAQFESVRGDLPTNRRGGVTFAYITGWRMPSEVFTLQWRQIDFDAGTVRLDPGSTKNQEGRVFPFTPELRAVLEAEWAATAELQRRLLEYPAESPTIFVGPPSETSSAPGCRGPLR